MLTQRLVFTKSFYDLLLETSKSEGAILSLVQDHDNNMYIKIHNTRQYFYLDRVNTMRVDQKDVYGDIDQMDRSMDEFLYKYSLTMKTDDSKDDYFPNNGQDDEMEEDNRYVPKPNPKREPNIRSYYRYNRYNRYNKARHHRKMKQNSS